MTTACGSTTSSQDTQLTGKIPLEEAPFEVYLKILRDEGYEEDAQLSEILYVETLTSIEYEPGKTYTREQIMRTPFKNLVEAMEKLLTTTLQQLEEARGEALIPNPLTGKSLMGEGAEGLSPENLNYVSLRQAQLHDEEKARLRMR